LAPKTKDQQLGWVSLLVGGTIAFAHSDNRAKCAERLAMLASSNQAL
jgi:hypothetical protein